MAWIFQCFFWITLTTTLAYRCRHRFPPFFPAIDYPYYSGESPSYQQHGQNRRIDYDAYRSRDHYRMRERSAEHMNERPTQRMNERSIPLNSDVQRVQEQEKKRLESRVEDPTSRSENGSYKIVNIYPRPYPSVANKRGQIEEKKPSVRDSVVFPGPTADTSQHQYVPNIPEECKKNGYCEDLPDYPEDHVASLIAQLGDEVERFRVDEMEPQEIAQRIGPAEEQELCDFTPKVVIPRAAADREGKWYYIVNRKDKPLQGYHVEECKRIDKNTASPCKKLAYFPVGYVATCKQKFVQRYMTAIDEFGNRIEKSFPLPSCCSCVVKVD